MPVKGGWKTSEFWMAVVAAVLTMLKQFGWSDSPAEGIYAVVAYVLGRAFVKGMKREGDSS